jgi:hypothetical protein
VKLSFVIKLHFVSSFPTRNIGSRSSRRWEDNITTDLREIGLEVVNWMHLVQDRDQCRAVMNTVMKLRDLDYLASYE